MRYIRSVCVIVMLILITVPILAQESEGTHVVQSGENLFRIALRYGVDMDELARINNISDVRQIYAGQVLIIPGLDVVTEGDVIANPLIAATPVIHVVQRGEYLGQIASAYNVTVADILAANNIANANTIYPGQELQIWTNDLSVAIPDETMAAEPEAITDVIPTPVPAVQVEQVVHIVAPGEYLSLIARNYGIPWTSIAEANGIVDPNRVTVGTALIIPGADPSASSGIVGSTNYNPASIPAPGAHWGVGREIVVDLSTQMTYAYEDGALQFSALVSTGLPATPTVQGEYAIWHRTPSQTMTGPGYYLPNVQWVMYFYQGYGFHGTYWHNNFGHPMSHGCVNMTNDDALWLYNFANIGTHVWVQY